MTPEKKVLIEQLLEMGDVRFVKSDARRNKLIVKSISEMDLEQLEILTENYLSQSKREDFLKEIKSKFIKFNFNGGDLTSDSGLILLREFDEKLGFSS